jgi:hypothetical protein
LPTHDNAALAALLARGTVSERVMALLQARPVLLVDVVPSTIERHFAEISKYGCVLLRAAPVIWRDNQLASEIVGLNLGRVAPHGDRASSRRGQLRVKCFA